MPENGPARAARPGEIAALLFAALLPAAAAWLYFVVYADAAFMPALYGASKVVQFSFPVAWLLLARRWRPSAPRLPRGGLAGGLWSGVAIVALLWGIYVAALRGSDLAALAAPRIQARIEAIGAGTPLKYLLMTLGLSVVHSFLEEYYWRWFVFGRLRSLIGLGAAAVVSSLAFAAHHVIVVHAFVGFGPYWWMTLLLSAAVVLGGGLWAWLYARHGSLYAPWLSHVLADLAILAIGYDLVRGLA